MLLAWLLYNDQGKTVGYLFKYKYDHVYPKFATYNSFGIIYNRKEKPKYTFEVIFEDSNIRLVTYDHSHLIRDYFLVGRWRIFNIEEKLRQNIWQEVMKMAGIMVKTVKTEGVGAVTTNGFWADKQPCWEKCHCPEMIRQECPASRYQFLPCCEIEGTYCKLNDFGAKGNDTSICQVCRVYKKYGKEKPIELKILGRGLNVSLLDKVNKM